MSRYKEGISIEKLQKLIEDCKNNAGEIVIRFGENEEASGIRSVCLALERLIYHKEDCPYLEKDGVHLPQCLQNDNCFLKRCIITEKNETQENIDWMINHLTKENNRCQE